MNFVISVSTIGISACLLLGTLYLLKSKRRLVSNVFLGTFFFLLAIKLGKLLAQEYGTNGFLNAYFNLMHGANLAIGPVAWLYIQSYVSPVMVDSRHLFRHFAPSIIFLFGALYIRRFSGESIWAILYWGIQFHPILYVSFAMGWLANHSRYNRLSINQTIWLGSLLGIVFLIAIMNMLFYTMNFPFYFVTSLLSIATVYLICFLAFSDKLNVLIGKSDRKYRNINLDDEHTRRLHQELEGLLRKELLYLDDRLRLSDIARKMGTSSHVISRVINEHSGKSFPQYINHLRVSRAKKHLIQELDKKVISVALESGFRSLSAFNRHFKEVAGMNPSEYRLKYSSNATPDL